MYMKRSSAYLIDMVRAPVGVVLIFVSWWIMYRVSGTAGQVGGANAAGFLLVGMLGLLTWSSSIWSSGYAIEHERHEGTIGALFLSPASRAAVVMGYGLGSFVWELPSLVVVGLIALLTGARFDVSDPFAALAALGALYLGSLCVGFAFSGLFVLSRRGNLLANSLQMPIWLLAGFVVPRDRLPGWVQPLSDAIPASHAIDALRASTLRGARLGDIAGTLALAVATSAAFALIGFVALRRVERVAKRAGQLEFY
jgi:ABC-2 type transport system permease protein